MAVDPADEQVGGGLVASRLGGLERSCAGSSQRAVVIAQFTAQSGSTVVAMVTQGRGGGDRLQSGWSPLTEGAQALRQLIGGVEQVLILFGKRIVQGEESSALDVPVGGVGLHRQGIGVGENGVQGIDDSGDGGHEDDSFPGSLVFSSSPATAAASLAAHAEADDAASAGGSHSCHQRTVA